MSGDSTREALAQLETVYASDGVRSAIAFLNSLTPHRFTSLYRFDGAALRNITFFDRENPHVESCEDIPVEASYCVFIRDSGTKFLVPDAPHDERL